MPRLKKKSMQMKISSRRKTYGKISNDHQDTTSSIFESQLSALVGPVNTYIPDDVITASFLLMKDHPRGQFLNIGQSTPAAIEVLMQNDSMRNELIQCPSDKMSINIHYINAHWVTSLYNPNNGRVHIYDSMWNNHNMRQANLIKQIDILYGVYARHIFYIPVMLQGSDPLCGAFALAFAFSILFEDKPEEQVYDVTLMRHHLKSCLNSALVSPFPVKPASMIACNTTTTGSMHTSRKLDTVCNINMKRYFSFQDIQLKKKQKKETSESNDYTANTQIIYDASRSSQRVKKQQILDKERKARYRSTRNTTQIENDRIKDRTRKFSSHITRDDTTKEMDKVLNRTRMSRSRSAKDASRIEMDNRKDRTRKSKYRIAQHYTWKETDKIVNRTRMSRSRSAKDASQIEMDNRKDRTRKSKYRIAQDYTGKETDKIVNRTRMSRSRSARDATQIAADNVNDKTRKCRSRSARDATQIATDSINDKTRKSGSRSARDVTQIAADKLNDKTRKCRSRSAKDTTQITAHSINDKTRKSRSRSARDATQIAADNVNDKTRKCRSRSARDVTQIAANKLNDKTRKCRSRSATDVTQIAANKLNDKTRKCRSRSARDATQIATDSINDKTRKSGSRSARDVTQIAADKLNDRTRKSRSRSARDVTQIAAHKLNDKTRKCRSRSAKDTTQITAHKLNDRTRKSRSRSARDVTQIAAHKLNDRTRKSRSRSARDVTQIAADSINDKTKQFRSRSARDATQIAADSIDDKTRKCRSRSARDATQIAVDNINDKTRKYRSRSARDATQIATGIQNDRTRKSRSRSARDATQIATGIQNDRTRKSRLRSARDGTQIAADNINDQTRKSKFRSARDATHTEKEKKTNKKRMEQNRQNLRHDYEVLRQQTSSDNEPSYLTPAVKVCLEMFRKSIKSGPTFACATCLRSMYRTSVVKLHVGAYSKCSKELTEMCTRGNTDWVCKTCHSKLKTGRMPAQAQANNLELCDIPDELNRLCLVETHLIAKIIPFMKIVAKPTGAQHGLKGSVVLVPADLDKIISVLPRATPHSGLITLSLKRRLSDSQHVHQQYISPDYVNQALKFLMLTNPFYHGVIVNETWQEESKAFDSETWNALTSHNPKCDENNVLDGMEIEPQNMPLQRDEEDLAAKCQITDSEDELEDELSDEYKQQLKERRSIDVNTCMYPTFGPDINTDDIVNIAPGEGQRPISISKEPNWEAMAFPVLFPDGYNTYNNPRNPRTVSLSPKKYLNSRLLSLDSRFSQSTEYIFQSLHWAEIMALKSNLSINLRKNYHEDIAAGQLNNPSKIRRLLSNDQIFASFKNIRGTPQYWRAMQIDMLAKVRQMGPYTFFITGSSAEFQWTEVIQVIAQQYGTSLSIDDINKLSWQEKRTWLQRNPVTAARHINHIFEQLWGKVILGGAHPIGQILTYDRRMEMQGRGTAHWHAAVIVKEAPCIDVQTDDEVVSFIDNTICCNIPDEKKDPLLHTLVTSRQKHHHTKTCKKKKGVACRFHYPRPPSNKTIITRPYIEEEPSHNRLQAAKKILGKVLDVIQAPYKGTLEQLLANIGHTVYQYEEALKISGGRIAICMKRSVHDCNINNYNPVLLLALQSNMDIQYITNIWACIAYLCSYMCKPERTMSELMKKASKEATEKSVKDQLFNIGQVFLKHREVSEHEAIARLLSMPMRRSDLDVVFVATDVKQNRTRLMKPISVISTLEDDDTDLYIPSIHDKYAARPVQLDNCCLAEFSTSYTVKSVQCDAEKTCEIDNQQTATSSTIILNDGLGYLRKRCRPSVLRYHYVSKQKDSEQYYHRLLLLYHPWRDENQLKHEDGKYETKFMQLKELLIPSIIKYESFTDDVGEVLENFDPDDSPNSIWNDLTSQREQELADFTNEDDTKFAMLDQEHLQDPSDISSVRNVEAYSMDKNTRLQSDDDYYGMVSTLNSKQRTLFQYIFQWSMNNRLSLQPSHPFYIFLSGEGGTGKSHLIHALYQCITRTLRQPGDDPEKPSVLLTAYTGKAASNINGSTLHSAFPLPIHDQFSKQSRQYKKPAAEKLARLRNQYSALKILIIDEISMVVGTALEHLSLALQDIKENNQTFGGISILAVGDLLQLNPVGDRAVFLPSSKDYQALYGSIWERHFTLYQLTDIIRQKGDPVFRDILSRIRVGKHTEEDVEELKRLQHSPLASTDEEMIHLFITNQKANEYNQTMIDKSCNYTSITAKDSSKDLLTGTKVFVGTTNIHDTGNLPSELQVAVGARFMLTKNINIADMLVNGATGTVVKLSIPANKSPLEGIIFVKFDNDKAGIQARRGNPPHLKDAVPIRAVTAQFMVARKKLVPVERTQYPGVLAWGVTVHKSQGSTYSSMVGDLTTGPRTPISQGLVYTMLSRVTSREGLRLVNFDPSKIKVNRSAMTEMERLQRDAVFTYVHPLLSLPSELIVIGTLNIRSLPKHHSDFLSEEFPIKVAFLCLTETHLPETSPSNAYALPEHSFLPKCTTHGLGIFYDDNYQATELPCADNFEIMATIFKSTCHQDLLIILVYRPPGSHKDFIQHLDRQLSLLPLNDMLTIVTGDFNMPHHENLDILLSKYKLVQLVNGPTHREGGQLDLIFTNSALQISTVPVPVFFSDHFLVWTTV